MAFLKIVKNQEINLDSYIKLKNKSCEIVFACENSLLSNYYENTPSHNVNPKNFIPLAHLFSHNLVQFFGTKIPGGLFEVTQVSSSSLLEDNFNFVDIALGDEANPNFNCVARLFGAPAVMDSVNKFILEKTILTQVPKHTGYPALVGQIELESIYKVTFCEHIRSLRDRHLFLKCTYSIEDNLVSFYFSEKIIKYFSSLMLKNTSENTIKLNLTLGKLFAQLFYHSISTSCSIFVKPVQVELQYIKDKDFLEFNLESQNHKFEFFSEPKNKLLLRKILHTLQFKPIQENNEKASLHLLKMPFSAEIGVAYLNNKEYKNLTEGDIIVFDKTCISAEATVVDKCVINLNGLNLIAELRNNSCQVIHFTKDW